VKSSNQEAPGRVEKPISQASCLEAKEASKSGELPELTEAELESLLARCRLKKEQNLLTAANKGDVACVQSAAKKLELSIGTCIYLHMTVGGVQVAAMVDTGSQSTIIAWSFLHQIARKCRDEGSDLPELSMPTVRLFGKDGQEGGHELVITAQVDLVLSADGKTVTVPVFVQPCSTQECLLGMNAVPLLGLAFLDNKGEPLHTVPECVSLM